MLGKWKKRTGRDPVEEAQSLRPRLILKYATLCLAILTRLTMTYLGMSNMPYVDAAIAIVFVAAWLYSPGPSVWLFDGDDRSFPYYYGLFYRWAGTPPRLIALKDETELRELAKTILVRRAKEVLNVQNEYGIESIEAASARARFDWVYLVLNALGIAAKGYDRYYDLAQKQIA